MTKVEAPSAPKVLLPKFRRTELFVGSRLASLGWQRLFYDVRVNGVQIDWILRSPGGVLTLVEVKTQNSARWARISPAQMRRLVRCCTFLAQWEPVEVRLALVEGQNVRLLPVDALTG